MFDSPSFSPSPSTNPQAQNHTKTSEESEHLIDDPQNIPESVRCCCRQRDCASRLHSLHLVQRAERDVRTAGELGHALLIRHENYVAESETERKRMLAKMEDMEQEKLDLEDRNRLTIDENRKLLDQLETLNLAVADTELHTRDLEETLRSTEQELIRMQALVAQTEKLQGQLTKLEEEQEALRNACHKSRDEERAALVRSQQAERTIVSLHLQVEEIERQAREEQERHDEVLNRIDKRRAAESDLLVNDISVNGPLQAAQGGSVISSFVKDILQDNANLQLGIVELRELLQKANDEVEGYRRKKSADQSPDRTPVAKRSPVLNLGSELNAKELHVHHHYHASSPTTENARVPRPQVYRRTRRKRVQHPSSSIPSTPLMSPSPFRPSSPVSASALLSAITVPHQRAGTQRWSMQSVQTGLTSGSSVPSSPYSESIFDRSFGNLNLDSSRPTSPESDAMFSPRQSGGPNSLDGFATTQHRRSGSNTSKRSIDRNSSLGGPEEGHIYQPQPSRLLRSSKRSCSALNALAKARDVIVEEVEDHDDEDIGLGDHTEDRSETPVEYVDTPLSPLFLAQDRSRRGSIVSISGMDISVSARPSQLFAGGRPGIRNFSAPVVPATTSTTSAVVSQHRVTALRSVSSHQALSSGLGSSRDMLANLAGGAERTTPSLQKKQSLSFLESGKKVGGWVFGKWGSTTSAAEAGDAVSNEQSSAGASIGASRFNPDLASSNRTANLFSSAQQPDFSTSARPNYSPSISASSTTSASALSTTATSASSRVPIVNQISKPHAPPIPTLKRKSTFKTRAPGINQSGPIWGFLGPEPPTPFKAQAVEGEVDVGELRRATGGE